MKQIFRTVLFLGMLMICVGARAQDHYVVLIGVETYDTSTFKNLEFAGDDAIALSAQFQRLGFKTTVMTSESESAKLRPTTPKKIIDAIQAVGRSCAAEDTLVIGLSGHGVQFSDEELLPSGVRETYFCPSDADLKDKSSLLKISTIVDTMNQTKATKKLLLIDACQENVLSAEGQRKGSKLIDLGSVHETRKTVPGGIAILFSCSDKQYSWEHGPLGHSVFSYHVIEYLRGSAEARYYDEGKMELSGLVSYVAKNTNDYVIQNNLTPDGQYPVLRGNTTNWTLGNRPVAPRSRPPGANMSKLVEPILEIQTIRNSVDMQFVPIPSGTFMMGSPETEKGRFFNEVLRQVTISKPFYMSVTEVTQAQYQAIMASNPSDFKQPQHPVENVTWEDAFRFCEELSRRKEEIEAGRKYRMPTEEEWEHSARAGRTTAYYFGDDAADLPEFAWFKANTDGIKTKVVRTKAPNSWGLYDMYGNVYEWCSDWDRDQSGKQSSNRIMRGGAYNSTAKYLRSASREAFPPQTSKPFCGIRVVMENIQAK